MPLLPPSCFFFSLYSLITCAIACSAVGSLYLSLFILISPFIRRSRLPWVSWSRLSSEYEKRETTAAISL
nr:MAG TPA: hypothetical protein [Caudoviricetes sp.]